MLIDAHAHLDKYEENLDAALQEISDGQIFTISVSIDLPSYERNVEIGEMSDLILPTFGVHPKNAPRYASRLSELSQAIEQSPALGEIGLDFHWIEDPATYPAQKKVLEYFLAAAREQRKIVNLHTKGAEKEILNLLERYDIARPVIHWYSGTVDMLRPLISYGAYFTIGVEVLYSSTIQAIAREIPLSRLLTETDNPGGLKWLKGKIGMPGVLHEVAEKLAELKQNTADSIMETIEENFLRITRDDPWLEGKLPIRYQ